MTIDIVPPQEMIDRAHFAARQSTCLKSRRGVVVYDPHTLQLLGRGWNSQPEPMVCTGTDACRANCNKLCVHAESRALGVARMTAYCDKHLLSNTHMLHVKVVDGDVVPGGGPSCWQCSREVLDADLGGVWLYEHDNRVPGAPGLWRFYRALEFHQATLRACGILP